MRVTQGSYYNNFDKNSHNAQHELDRINKQLASGKSIEYGYEDPQTFITTMRLDNDINGMEQARRISQRAVSFTDYTDSTLTDMKEVLDKFKVKLVNAASDSNGSASLSAIADELRAYQEHLMNLANATGDGKYLFAGTALEKPPINKAGEYLGNDGLLKAFLGDSVEQPYNIPGTELFLGENGDIHRKITTNVKLYNQTMKHPEAMIEGGVPEQAKDVILRRDDTVRDMVGDDDANTKNNENTYFYIRGRRSDGFTFKERFEMTSDARVQDVLDRIGKAFGNTPRSKIVDVNIDNAGYIEITDRKTGSSKIDFHMISSHEDVDNIDMLSEIGAEIQTYNNSDFQGSRINHTVSAANSQYDHRDFTINTVLKDYEGNFATSYTLVRDAMPQVTDGIVLNGIDVDGNAIQNVKFPIDDMTTMHDVMTFMEDIYGGKNHEVVVRLSDGRILLTDQSITPHEPSRMFTTLTSMAGEEKITGFTSLSEMEYDRAYWEKDGSMLKSTIPQITRKGNDRATEHTRLLDVAGDITTVGTTLDLKGKNVYGMEVDFSLTLGEHPDCACFLDNSTGKKYNVIAHGRTTDGDGMTYRQLFDVIQMIMSGHLPKSADPTYMEDYLIASANAEDMVEVKFDQAGKIVVKDRLNSVTRMEMTMYDNQTNDFSDPRVRHPLFTFHANNTLTIDDPKTDFFDLIEGAVRSVELERKRPDGDSRDEPRNIGVQNAIVSIEHLLEHVTNSHSRNGAQSNAIRFAQERNEAWIVNAKSVQSEALDTDMAEATMKFNQLSNSYQAMLSTVNRVNKLALVNYL